MNRYRVNEYWLRLAYWALTKVRFQTGTMRADLIDCRRSVTTLGMMNSGILLREKERK